MPPAWPWSSPVTGISGIEWWWQPSKRHRIPAKHYGEAERNRIRPADIAFPPYHLTLLTLTNDTKMARLIGTEKL
jgi:hypothetical protein